MSESNSMTSSMESSVLGGGILVDQKFNLNVIRGEGCWEWVGLMSGQGYGKVWRNNRYQSAHRLAFQYVYGELPSGIYVCHKCDNRKCVRPDHLFAGSAADNNRDMWDKGRGIVNGISLPGELNPAAILNERDVLLIRRLVQLGVKQIIVAKVFGASDATISDIIRGKKWKHV